jgi:hypothetical protein
VLGDLVVKKLIVFQQAHMPWWRVLIGSTGAYALVESVDDVVMLENYGTPEDLDGFYVKFCYSVSGVSRSYA